MNFISHAKLFDQPDPRRLDLRASISSVGNDWLVRVNQQRVAITVSVIVDVSSGMHFQGVYKKIDVVASFLEALGYSASATGDSIGLYGFDQVPRPELTVPARFGRAVGHNLAQVVLSCRPAAGNKQVHASVKASVSPAPGNSFNDGLDNSLDNNLDNNLDDGTDSRVENIGQCIGLAASHSSLVFLVSDYHWPLAGLHSVLDPLADALLVPVVVWDPLEIEPPQGNRLLSAQQLGSRRTRHLWLTPRLRKQWLENVAHREREITGVFARRDIKPFFVKDSFSSAAMSEYFMGWGMQ